MINKLEIYIWDKHVGTLVAYKEKYKEKYSFYFDKNFLSSGIDISPLRASIYSENVKSGLPIYGEEAKIFGGLPSFIADSLPDHWGSTLFSQWARAKGIRNKDLSPLDKLIYIGKRGMGALEYRPPLAEEMETPFKVNISDLYGLAKEAVKEADDTKFSMSEIMIQSLFRVGTSAGGKRPKAVINVNPDTHEVYSGQVAAPEKGFIPMIIKFDEGVNMPSTRIEYTYYLMAKTAGLKMMPSSLMIQGENAHFLTERFDRQEDKKLHIQTLAAMAPYSRSYEDLFEVAVKLKVLPEELSQLFLNLALNVITGNVDDHNKNFSFIMNLDGEWHVAPAYDFTFAVDTSMPRYMNRHSMTLNGKDEMFVRKDLLECAAKFNIKSPDELIDRALESANHFEEFAAEAHLPGIWIERIQKEIESRSAAIL